MFAVVVTFVSNTVGQVCAPPTIRQSCPSQVRLLDLAQLTCVEPRHISGPKLLPSLVRGLPAQPWT